MESPSYPLKVGDVFMSLNDLEAIRKNFVAFNLPEIPKSEFDLSTLVPPAPRPKLPNGKNQMVPAFVSLDLEADGDDRHPIVSGTDVVSVGMTIIGQVEVNGPLVVLANYEASCDYANEEQLELNVVKNKFWMVGDEPGEGWKRLVRGQRDRREVALEIQILINELKNLGWSCHLFARPVGYDFRQIHGFFTSLGLHCPFGFGGAGGVTDMGQKVNAFQLCYGVPETSFNIVMKNVIGRDNLSHGGLQDAMDQLVTYMVITDLIKRINANHDDRDRELLVNLLTVH